MKNTMGTFRNEMGEELEELFKNFTPAEKKLYGKTCNSTDPMIYILGAADALELNGIEISDSFIKLINSMQFYF